MSTNLLFRIKLAFCTLFAFFLGFAEIAFPMEEKDRQLLKAATENNLPQLEQLIKEGARVDAKDARGRTPLLIAVDKNHVEVARVLIAAGADVNAQDMIEDSPWLLAGASGRLEILKLMLGSEPNFKLLNRYGGTALIPACERGHVEVVKFLLNTDTPIDHVNHLGWTALMEAVVLSDGGIGHQQIVQMLVDAGANVNIPDNKGISPLQHARAKGFNKIAKTLESAGAR